LLASLTKAVTYLLQSVLLFLFKDYTLTLLVGIVTNIIINFFISLYITKEYKDVFAVKEKISKEERTNIIRETKACMCHKVGGVVLNSTDNIILSKFTSLFIVGVYSNYTMIINNMTTIITQILTNFVSSVGDAHFKLDKNREYDIYKKLLFVNFWIASVVTISLYALINPFISLWVGDALLMSETTIICLCIQFYLEIIRRITMTYTNACGLFTKDIARPIIEAIINIVISIVLVIKIGVAGVFLGTIISHLVTVFWREPLILYKNEFEISVKQYWKTFILFSTYTFFMCILFRYLSLIFVSGMISWIVMGIGILIISNALLCMLLYNRYEFRFFKSLIIKFLRK
jgi:O-antigen/teichoic acid export membrane protein